MIFIGTEQLHLKWWWSCSDNNHTDSTHTDSSHPRQFPHRQSPPQTIPTYNPHPRQYPHKVPTPDNTHTDNPHPRQYPHRQSPPQTISPRQKPPMTITPWTTTPTRKFEIILIRKCPRGKILWGVVQSGLFKREFGVVGGGGAVGIALTWFTPLFLPHLPYQIPRQFHLN